MTSVNDLFHTTTPMEVEAQLKRLYGEIGEATEALKNAEAVYYAAKHEYEVGVAAARMSEGARAASKGVRLTVQEKEDAALLATADLLKRLYTADALQRACKANINRINTQTDIARSVGTSVRTSINLT